MLALDGGSDGLDFYRTIIKEAADCLKKDGVIMGAAVFTGETDIAAIMFSHRND